MAVKSEACDPARVAIIQARMGSTRLPGKVLMRVLGKPLLEFQIERLARCRQFSKLVVATTEAKGDDAIADFCKAHGVACFRGSEDDVLGRYAGAAAACGAGVVARLTADCPLMDPDVVDRVFAAYAAANSEDAYAQNVLQRTYPRGLDTEVFSAAALRRAAAAAHDPYEREHVTPYLQRHPEFFRRVDVVNDTDASRHRWTVDTPEDFDLVRRIIEALYPGRPAFTSAEVLDLLALHPDWVAINAGIRQKT